MSYGFEPHGTFGLAVPHPSLAVMLAVGREGVPGVVGMGGAGRGAIPGTQPSHPGTHIFIIFSLKALPMAK